MKAQLLKRCGGACAGEGKVGYCGRDCQRLVSPVDGFSSSNWVPREGRVLMCLFECL
ncbi:hypothetical protein C8Q80DRAFT_1147530 [Daedaleopsis nitida]|nr:hypothetical protein C8Q80DRAFT_1147530 [Daedaleopsis nitida]